MTQLKPEAGQVWNLNDYIGKVAFATMIGTYGQTPGAGALDNMSVHYWHLKDTADTQTPHKQDELYYVIQGAGAITVNGVKQSLEKGNLVFVPRHAEHRFSDFEKEGLHLLIFFSPDFTG